jgi:SHS2 domain-containing protein
MADEKIEFLEHTADIAVRIHAKNECALFELAAQAVYSILARTIVVNNESPTESITIEIRAANLEDLFHDWLAEILFYFQTRNLYFEKFRIETLTENYFKTVAEGKKINTNKTDVTMEIKAVTYHRLKVDRTPQGLTATVIFDI